MNFTKNYTDFFDIRSLEIFEMTIVYKDFVDGLQAFLKSFIGDGLPDDRAGTIARTVVGSMSDPSLHYHTPVHVLSMFQFAEQNGLEIGCANELAVWFHDSIYVPGKEGQNEPCSGHFMKALLDPFLDEAISQKVDGIIQATAKHLEEVSVDHMLIMDLDLCAFAFENQDVVQQCVRDEYPDLNDTEYAERRKAFLEALIAKGHVFRSAVFRDRFDDIAMKNIKALL